MAWSWLIMAGCLASCSFEVRSLARGRQHPGMVSIRVGLEWVSSGFIRLSSILDHSRARADLPGAPPRGESAPFSELKKQ